MPDAKLKLRNINVVSRSDTNKIEDVISVRRLSRIEAGHVADSRRKIGRPRTRTEKWITRSVEIPSTLNEKLVIESSMRGISVSAYLRQIIESIFEDA